MTCRRYWRSGPPIGIDVPDPAGQPFSFVVGLPNLVAEAFWLNVAPLWGTIDAPSLVIEAFFFAPDLPSFAIGEIFPDATLFWGTAASRSPAAEAFFPTVGVRIGFSAIRPTA
jgi:hypothetical protein